MTQISRYFRKAMKDDLLTQAAAIAYYASLSIPPLVLLALAALSFMGFDLSGELVVQVERLLGPRPAAAIIGIIEAARDYSVYSTLGQILGTLLLVFSASAVMAQMHTTLNLIYGPARGRSAWLAIVIQRVVSLAVVLLFILLAVLSVLSAVLVASITDTQLAWWANVVHTLASIALFFGLFTLLFRLVPDCPPRWRSCASGGAFTAVLFLAGKAPLSAVIEQSISTSLYGAAGALMFLLVWVYYSSLIICLGAEFAYFVDRGSLRSATIKQGVMHGTTKVRKLRQRLRQGLSGRTHGREPQLR